MADGTLVQWGRVVGDIGEAEPVERLRRRQTAWPPAAGRVVSVQQAVERVAVDARRPVGCGRAERGGERVVRADVTEDIKEGVVWTTPHFAAASANRLTNDVLDERSKIPEYKAASAEIEVDIEPASGDAPASADD